MISRWLLATGLLLTSCAVGLAGGPESNVRAAGWRRESTLPLPDASGIRLLQRYHRDTSLGNPPDAAIWDQEVRGGARGRDDKFDAVQGPEHRRHVVPMVTSTQRGNIFCISCYGFALQLHAERSCHLHYH